MIVQKIKNMFAAFSTAALLIVSGCNDQDKDIWTRQRYRKAATALYQRELYRESINMYEKYLHSPVISEEDIAKVLYQMGNIYLDNLKNPSAALANFTLIQSLFPDVNFNRQLGKKIVKCLEQSGRNTDAKQVLKSLTTMGSQYETPLNAIVVAEIDDRRITLNELEQTLGKLPESLMEQNQMISQYVSQILIAEAAFRKGLADNPDVMKKIAFMRNQILAQESLKEELNIPSPSQNDLKYYFKANSEKFQTGDDSLATFEQIIQKVNQAWMMEKQNEKYQAYVNKLLQSDRVKIYGTTGKPN